MPNKPHFEKRRVSDNTIRNEDKLKLDSYLYAESVVKNKDKSAKVSQNTSVITQSTAATPQTTTNANAKKITNVYYSNHN